MKYSGDRNPLKFSVQYRESVIGQRWEIDQNRRVFGSFTLYLASPLNKLVKNWRLINHLKLHKILTSCICTNP